MDIVQSDTKFKTNLNAKSQVFGFQNFKFLEKCHHSDIELISDTTATVHNESRKYLIILDDMDFGAVIGPTLTSANYRVAICLDRNDKYQSFMGVGVCHPKIVK